MYKNVHIFCKNPAKNIERFGIYLKNQEKGLKVLYVFILGGFGMIFVIPRQKRGALTGRYCNRDH